VPRGVAELCRTGRQYSFPLSKISVADLQHELGDLSVAWGRGHSEGGAHQRNNRCDAFFLASRRGEIPFLLMEQPSFRSASHLA
jgi:hypothetical protein